MRNKHKILLVTHDTPKDTVDFLAAHRTKAARKKGKKLTREAARKCFKLLGPKGND